MSTGAGVMLIVSQVKRLLKCVLFMRLFRCSGLREMYIHWSSYTHKIACNSGFIPQHMYLKKIVMVASVALVVTPVHVIFSCIQARGTCSPEIFAIYSVMPHMHSLSVVLGDGST